jgi:tetratricopeptide (TPR) repeat protein
LIIQIFLLSSVTASELSQASIAYNYYSTSDDFLIKTTTLKFSSNRRELFWPYDEAYEEPVLDIGFTVDQNDGFLDGDEFNGVRLAPFIAKKFSSDLYLKAGFLYNHVKRKESSDERVESHIGAQLEGKLIKDEKLFLRLEFLEDYLYTQFLFPGGANKFLTAKFITSNILYTHVNKFRWNSQIRQTYYEDNNDSLNIDSEYKDVKTLLELVKQGYEELLRLKAAEEAEKERKKRQLQVKKLMTKTVKAVKERNIKVAESLFAQVLEIDPENIDIPQLKIEIEAYKEKQAQIKLEKERARVKRQKMVDALAPGKNLFLKQKWYLAIGKLENFNKLKAMDEDLIEEATKMLKEAKIKLDAIVSPLIAKARSYKEGQDYKRAYETYGEVLKFNPASEEALNERDSILDRLDNNSKKIYREALISESLSLFSEAKEKFQQVQQISPINSEYYIKATEKLKDYLE